MEIYYIYFLLRSAWQGINKRDKLREDYLIFFYFLIFNENVIASYSRAVI